tara:strand:+ start:44 stop:292 length:249 start_codon:yes stop_codon:yes gene_type:complete
MSIENKKYKSESYEAWDMCSHYVLLPWGTTAQIITFMNDNFNIYGSGDRPIYHQAVKQCFDLDVLAFHSANNIILNMINKQT